MLTLYRPIVVTTNRSEHDLNLSNSLFFQLIWNSEIEESQIQLIY